MPLCRIGGTKTVQICLNVYNIRRDPCVQSITQIIIAEEQFSSFPEIPTSESPTNKTLEITHQSSGPELRG